MNNRYIKQIGGTTMIKICSISEWVNRNTDIKNKDITDNNDEMHQEHISLYVSTAPEEERLLNKIYEFEEEYFTDLTLKDYEKDLAGYRKKLIVKWETDNGDLLVNENMSFIDNKWKVKLMRSLVYLEGYYGFCNGKERLIAIAEPLKDDDLTLLHEMIHGYESMLEPYIGYHQFALIKLHEKLSLQIPNLYKIIEWDMHTKNTVYHSPLFLLKSLDLDIRLKQPFGSVYCYGREYYFRTFNPYAAKYRLLNANPPSKYKELIRQLRFSTVAEAKDFIIRYQTERMEKAKPKMVGFFPELFQPKPIEYCIFKRDSNNRYTNLIETIRDEEVLDSLSIYL